MKQNFLTASSASRRTSGHLIVLVTSALLSSTCATLPQHVTHAGLQEPPTEKTSRININAATAPALEKLPGVGKVIAERIVEHRTQYGAFRRPEHLMMVRGISDQKFRSLRGLITTE